MSFRYALAPVVFGALLSGCGAPDLTKDQAKTLLNDFFAKHPTVEPLATGMVSMGQAPEKEYFDTPGGKYQKALEEDGLITIVSDGKIFSPDDHSRYIYALEIALTDKGRQFVTGTPNTNQNPAPQKPTIYENAVFCGKEVVEVFAVTTNEDSADVDYTWRAAKLTPFAEDSHKMDPASKSTCDTAVLQRVSGALERKDNAWAVKVAQ